ncbi:Uncharacterised protein [Flavonifractor plautii]|uniref:Uncharacterized protein n=1 Tax=Flavonifractor plautii TaxID=292800 RepID=A0A174LYC4_FLAPL|nr:Uncharacterised protein [Flavonifractor plautii]
MPALLERRSRSKPMAPPHTAARTMRSRYSSSWIENQLMLQSPFCCAIHLANCSARAEEPFSSRCSCWAR